MDYAGRQPSNGNQQMQPPENLQWGNGLVYGGPQFQGTDRSAPIGAQGQPMPLYPNPMNNAPQYQGYYTQPPAASPVQYINPQHFQQTPAPVPSSQQQYAQPMPPPVPTPQQLPRPPPTFDGTVNMADIQPQRRASEGPVPMAASPKKQARKLMPASTTTAARSPTISHGSSNRVDTPSLLIGVAHECLRTARAAAQNVAAALDSTIMNEYYKLVATGLACLESALLSNKLPPRVEIIIRLQYTSILIDETNNLNEAELVLNKAIATCDKNRLIDLKYCVEVLLLKVLYRRNRKAAFVSIDNRISENMTYKQVPWVYAFRFLKAAFHLESGNSVDAQALDNLHNISAIANERGDLAVSVLVSLMEGIMHLKSLKEGMCLRVQTCLAQAAKHQMDPSVHIPQLDILALFLDLSCALQQRAPQLAMQKLKNLQTRIDEVRQMPDWNDSDELLLPFKKHPGSSQLISEDTNTIIRPGPASGDYDFLVLSFVSKMQAYVITYIFAGITYCFDPPKQGNVFKPEKSMEVWLEALHTLAKVDVQMRARPSSLPMALEQAKWRAEVTCYTYVLIALTSASHTQWTKVRECIQKIRELGGPAMDESMELLALYVSGVYHQGTGDLNTALQIFQDPRFALPDTGLNAISIGQGLSVVAILAALNRLWILQEPSLRDEAQVSELTHKLNLYCAENADTDITTAFNLALVTIETNPPMSNSQTKRHIGIGINASQQTGNTQLLCITLIIMRKCLFEKHVNTQAHKSSKACIAQAKRSGNLLWMSVGDGMYAETMEMNGDLSGAQKLRESGTLCANQALKRAN